MIIAGRDQGNAAFVLRLICVRMDSFVQLRRDRERESKDKRRDQSEMDRPAFHGEPTFSLVSRSRNHFLGFSPATGQRRSDGLRVPAT